MHTRRSASEGSALLIVLGFLAILLLLVFAFSVKMQTEYRMARNSESSVRTKYVWVQGIHLTSLEAGHPRVSPFRSFFFYPRRELINGADVLVGDDGGGAIFTNFLASPADLFIPQAIYSIAMAEGMTNRLGILPSSFGGPVHDYYAACGEYERYVATGFEPSGVAYAMLNNSGYLDIHAPYQTATRRYGRDVSEIQLTDVIATPGSIAAGRSLHGRIESMMELYEYCTDFGFTGTTDPHLGFFTPYSFAVLGQYWSTNKDSCVNAVALTGTVTSIEANATDVKDAFAAAGFNQKIYIPYETAQPHVEVESAEMQKWLFDNLLDYMDDSSLYWPRGLSQPSQEALAGLSEIIVDGDFSCTKVSATGYTYRIQVKLSFEIWNPFLTPATMRTYDMGPMPPNAFGVTHLSGPGFAATQQSPPVPVMSLTAGPRNIKEFSQKITFPQISVNTGSQTNETVYQVRFSPLIMKSGGNNVDKVGGATSFSLTFTNHLPNIPANIGDVVTCSDRYQSLEVVDPRFNWDPTNGVYWVQRIGSSAGQTNQATVAYITNPNNMCDFAPGDDMDKATYAFSADRLPLDTIGELGYLVVAPWRTIRLCVRPNANQRVESVVDTFTLDTPGTRTRGLVSLNSCHTGVLQAAFNESYFDLYPGSASTNLSSENARKIAAAIVEHTYGTPITQTAAAMANGVTRGLLNVSDFGGISNVFSNASLMGTLGANCEFLREAVVRNTIGILTTRNVNYTAVLCATDEIDGGGPFDFNIRSPSRMGAERKAIAMVCRDPWSKETFVRHFRHLPNDGVLAQY